MATMQCAIKRCIAPTVTFTPARTCIPVLVPARPLRSPPALFHGPDYDGDMYRPFVSGFDNNPVVSSAEHPALLWQTGGFRFVIPCFNMGVPSHFTPANARVAAAFCGSSSQAAFLSARSPSHLPSSRTPRARPVPCAPLALVVLLPLLHRPSSHGLSWLRAGSAKRERSTTMNRVIRASAFVPHDGGKGLNRNLRCVVLTCGACYAAAPSALLLPRGTDTDPPRWRTDAARPRPYTGTGRPRRTDAGGMETRASGERTVLHLLGIRLRLNSVNLVYYQTMEVCTCVLLVVSSGQACLRTSGMRAPCTPFRSLCGSTSEPFHRLPFSSRAGNDNDATPNTINAPPSARRHLTPTEVALPSCERVRKIALSY
ncbi:hypothetical protein B0H14DRAFT_3604256 [Mycena olivaceomarginata]|nr:hypothetical protein B0H14DRAFT_3604256 [Mycena olivaceomarginata]